MNNLKYLKNVVTLNLDSSKCGGCGMCVLVCPHRVFKMDSRIAFIDNKDRCMECGACAINCKDGAITVRSGVGCAAAIINSYVKKTEPTCSCS